MKKFLIIQTAFLGDVVLATPMAETLRKNIPDCEVHFLVKKGNESLLNNHPSIQKVFVFDKKKGKSKELLRLRPLLKKERYDVTYNLHRFGSSGLLTYFSGAKKTVGFKKHPFSFLFNEKIEHEIGNGLHEVDRNLKQIESLELKSLVRRPVLKFSESDANHVAQYKDDPYYCLAPASVWFTKQMPKEKWVELIKILLPKGKVFLLGGPDDADLCQRIAQPFEDVVSLAGKLSLLQSMALMESAERNYVNDSGPLHLASSVNAKVTAFFCSTTPDFGFGPLSEDSSVVQSTENLACKPCGLHGHKSCPEGHFKCGFGISVQ